MTLVPRWLIWCVYAVVATYRRQWRWRRVWGGGFGDASFGLAHEHPELKVPVEFYDDPFTKTRHGPCALYPITTVWLRIRLFPPGIQGPIWDCFQAPDYHHAQAATVAVPEVLPAIAEGERFQVMR